MYDNDTLRVDLSALPDPQRRLWEELAATPRQFVLYGGTAIALRLGHRQSMDFDFFTNTAFTPSDLMRHVPYLKGATVQQSSANVLTCLVDRNGPVQVSFFGGLSLNRIEDPDTASGVKVASPIDLAATKVKILLDRASAKDYLDLDALMKAGIELPQALSAACAVYGKEYNPLLSVKALTYFEDGDVKQLPSDVKQRLAKAAREVNLERLAVLLPQRGLDRSIGEPDETSWSDERTS